MSRPCLAPPWRRRWARTGPDLGPAVLAGAALEAGEL